MAKFCSKCGKELADDDLFCTQCGIRQEKIGTEPVITATPVMNDTSTTTSNNRDPKNTIGLENIKKMTYVAGALTAISVFCNFMELNMPGLADLSFSIMDISSLLGLYIMFLGIAGAYGTFKNKYGSSFAIQNDWYEGGHLCLKSFL